MSSLLHSHFLLLHTGNFVLNVITLAYYKQIRFSCMVLTVLLFWCHVQNKWAQWNFSQLYNAQQCSAMKFPRKLNKIWKVFIPFSVNKCYIPKLQHEERWPLSQKLCTEYLNLFANQHWMLCCQPVHVAKCKWCRL